MQFIEPNSFQLTYSLKLLLMVLVGGAGSFLGPFFGALIDLLLPEWLRFTQGYYLLIYAALVIMLMIFCPKGIVGAVIAAARTLVRPSRHPGRRSASRSRPPSQLPEDPMHTMTLTLGDDDARTAMEAIRAELVARGKMAVIAVVDAHGESMALLRMTRRAALLGEHRAATRPFPPPGFDGRRPRSAGACAIQRDGIDIAYYGDPRYIGWGGGLPVDSRWTGRRLGRGERALRRRGRGTLGIGIAAIKRPS